MMKKKNDIDRDLTRFKIRKNHARFSDCYLSYTKYDKMKFSSGYKFKSVEALYKPYAKS